MKGKLPRSSENESFDFLDTIFSFRRGYIHIFISSRSSVCLPFIFGHANSTTKREKESR